MKGINFDMRILIVVGLLVSSLLIFGSQSYYTAIFNQATVSGFIPREPVRDCRTWLPINFTLPNQQIKNLDLKNDSEGYEHRLEGWKKDWQFQVPNIPKSGMGSTLEASKNFRDALATIVDKLKEKLNKKTITILDAPCGDMTWMPTFLKSRSDVIYTGYELIPQNVENNRKNFSSEPWTFSQYDIVKTSINTKFDLIINRHVAIHLGLMDAMKMYANFLQSGSSYLLTTSFPPLAQNTELSLSESPGRQFHEVNLNLFPFLFPAPVCHNPDATSTQFMVMWKLEELTQFQKEAATWIQ